MPLASGLGASVGIAAEVTYGTFLQPSKFYEFRSESITQEIERVESEAIRAGQRVMRSEDWTPGNQKVFGDLELELSTKNWAFLFGHMLGGTVVTAGAGPFTHTATPGDLTSKSFSLQIGRPDTSGTVRVFSYSGCKITGWELSVSTGELALVTLSIVGKTETTATGLTTPSYTSSNNLFAYTHAAVTIGGASVPAKEISLSGDNGLDVERFFLGQPTISEPLEAAWRDYSGSATLDFASLTQYALFTAGTENALVLTLTRGGDIIQITTNARYDGATPEVGGPEILEQPVEFKCIGPSSDAGAITVVVTSSESSAL